jgi:TonB family protein
MSYRTIALASCLLMVGCGGAPPPSAAAPRSPGDSVAAVPPPGVTGKTAADEVGKKDSTTPSVGAPDAPATRAPGPPAPGAAGSDNGKNINQAVVETRSPLAGKLTQDDIRAILEKNGDVFGDCYTLGAGGKLKNFKGVVTVKATIGPKGAINQADVIKSTANNAKVDACVRESFKKIKFPPPHDGATTVITFPIIFNGVEQVQ